jgi:hypothetical protein
MSELELMKLLKYDDADLAANRLGQLTQKQRNLLDDKAKKDKNFYIIIGVVIALVACGGMFTRVVIPLLTGTGNSFLQTGELGPDVLISMLPTLGISGFFILLFGGVVILVLRTVFKKADRKVDTTVHRAEGKVNFVWVEREEPNHNDDGPMYNTVRLLEMRVGSDTNFTNVNSKLPNLLNQGDEWIFYYANHPFKILSAEKVK